MKWIGRHARGVFWVFALALGLTACASRDSSPPPPVPPTTGQHPASSAPQTPLHPVGNLENGMRIVVKDAPVINTLLAAADSFFIQEGQIVRSVDLLDRSKNLCFLKKSSASFNVHFDDVLKLEKIKITGDKLSAVSADSSVSMGCLKMNSHTEWTLEDLSLIFGSTAEIQVN